MASPKLQFALKKLGSVSDRLPQWIFQRNVQVLLDVGAAAVAIFVALVSRFEFSVPPLRNLISWLLIIPVSRVVFLLTTRAYRSTWRHFNLSDALDLGLKSLPVTLAVVAFRLFHGFGTSMPALPYSVALLELNLFILFAGGVRILRRLTNTSSPVAGERLYRTALVADEDTLSGAIKLVECYSGIRLISVIATNVDLHGFIVAGVPVEGGPESLADLIVSRDIELVLVGCRNRKTTEETIRTAAELGVEVRFLPNARDLVNGQARTSHIVKAEHLNGHHSMSVDPHPSVLSCFNERCVLVTGAGGSIGSEISRQLSRLPLSHLILFDHDENSIFELKNELSGTRVALYPYVGDIRDVRRLKQVFSLHRPEIIVHAAAYKHVPVMEANPCEAILNNVTGTRLLVEVAEDFGCERFLMISSDKAVNPTSIMGAAKRTAEVLVQYHATYSTRRPKTQFACVRFGNVLGSRGSVVPIFLRQIEAGGPVTVTHEHMTRYFMSIQQAVQLVLQSVTLASDGDIYMLDMGDPVKIVEFAGKLIRMSGLVPGRDIQIQIVGARPGEKIHEQLWCESADVSSTVFPYVFRVKAETPSSTLGNEIDALEKAAVGHADSDKIKRLLMSLPIDYAPEPQPEVGVVVDFHRNGTGKAMSATASSCD